MIDYHIIDHTLAFLLLVLLPILSLRSGELTDGVELQLPPKKHLFYTNGLSLIIGASIILTIWNGYHRPWASLGFSYILLQKKAIMAIIFLSIFYVLDIIYSVFVDLDKRLDEIQKLSDILPTNFAEYRHYTFLAFSAGFCEEIMFRGYLVPYLESLTQGISYSSHIAVLVPAIAFGLNHMYQGWKAILKIVFVAVMFGYIFLWTESIWIVIIIHVLIDLISGYVGMLSLKNR